MQDKTAAQAPWRESIRGTEARQASGSLGDLCFCFMGFWVICQRHAWETTGNPLADY
jgi:hypothetical protein